MSQPAPTPAAPHLPNPLTPLAFLPPEIGFELTVSTYVLVGSLAVLIWDILNNLGSDFILLTKFRVRFPTLVYFSSRILNLAYFILSAILNTVPTGNCGPLRKAASWLFVAAVSSTAALFLLRVTAMYDRNPYITAFFTAVWLLVPIGSGTLPFGISAMKLGPTNYCVSTTPAWFIVFTAITPLINDTLVFIALTGRLVQTAMDRPQSLVQRIRTIFLGTTLPAFSKAMLLDGQSYYLLTVGLRIFNFILLYAPGIPTVYRHTAGVPFIVVIHISACRVFRNTKFGIFRATTTSEVSRDARGPSMNWMKGVTTSKSSIAFASKSLAPSSTATVTGHHLGEHGEGVELQGRHGNGVMVSIHKHADGFDQDTSFDLKSDSFPQDPRLKAYEV